MLLTIVLVVISMCMSGIPQAFMDVRAFLIVVLGTITATFSCFTYADIKNLPKNLSAAMFYRKTEVKLYIALCLDIAQTVRYKGISATDVFAKDLKSFAILKQGINMYKDNATVEEACKIAQNSLESMIDMNKKSISLMKRAAEIAPSMGLIGTLIGLVQMLINLQDPNTLGPAMSVAILTTLYGTLLSFVICVPIATKLETILEDEIFIAKLSVFTVQSIGNNENPRNLETAINTLLHPDKQVQYFS